MTPAQMEQIGRRLYGHKRWRTGLARNLGLDRTTLWRFKKREQIPEVVEVAVRGLALRHKQLQDLKRAEHEQLVAAGLKRPRLRRKALPAQPANESLDVPSEEKDA